MATLIQQCYVFKFGFNSLYGSKVICSQGYKVRYHFSIWKWNERSAQDNSDMLIKGKHADRSVYFPNADVENGIVF